MTERFTAVVDHGAVDSTVDAAILHDQLVTAAALRDRLDENGGVILGDEVGTGKTYVTFALIVEALARAPERGAVIFVPSALLKEKWCRQLREYLLASMRDHGLGQKLAGRITPIDKGMRDDGSFGGEWGIKPRANSIVIGTHNIYSYQTSEADKVACLRAAAKRCDVGRRIKPAYLLRACGVDQQRGWQRWAREDVLDDATLAPMIPILQRYAVGERGLRDAASEAVQEVRLNVGRKLLPDAALVVVDEAHNLKSTHSANYRALMSVLSKQFDALLFLTATPFQLGRDELLNIVQFFRHSCAYAGRQEQFVSKVDAMRVGTDRWVDVLDRFGAAWRDLGENQVEAFRALIQDPTTVHPGSSPVAEQATALFGSCLSAKAQLEDGLRPFLLRSVRQRNHDEHCGVPVELISDDSRIPLALVDRLITELLQSQRRTFIASALISACSSWQALAAAAVTDERDDDAVDPHTRSIVRRMIEEGIVGEHPKVQRTLTVCRDGLRAGDKTLVFVERQQTGRYIRDTLEREFEGDAADAAALARLQDRTRFGWPSLRENYLHTIHSLVFEQVRAPSTVRDAWALTWVQALWSRVDAEGRRDYVLEKRFWEHVLTRLAAEVDPDSLGRVDGALRSCLDNLLEEDYILNGLDLVSGSSGIRKRVPNVASRSEPREPRLNFAEAFVAYPSPWIMGAEQLARLPPNLRSDFVDEAASAFARSHFRRELAALEIDADPAAHFQAVQGLLLGDGTWPYRFKALADQAQEAMSTSDAGLAEERVRALIHALGSNRRIQFIDGSTKTSTQSNAVHGFNTPLYPEVIVTTPVLAEGLDLHRFCRRVVHHDLPWNPAKLEQRTGRVDRVGSLAERLSQRDGPVPIDVWLPYVPGTYDEFVFDRVMARRREFRCVLGNRPEWHGDGELGDDERGAPMDEALATRLQADLGPGVSDEESERGPPRVPR